MRVGPPGEDGVTSVLIVQHAEEEPTPGDPVLTELGREQAGRTADHLASAAQAPVAVWSSPLRRARATAAPIADRFGLVLVIDDRLQERMNWEPDQPCDAFLEAWRRTSIQRDVVPPSGDSSQQAGARVASFLARWTSPHEPTSTDGGRPVGHEGDIVARCARQPASFPTSNSS